ncbi:MAG: anti-sigma-D factor RsdA [Actinophytocola sp.]|uniref:anti-sigma-D factor RsdA n=1 Tax=Actinophytocola sp. TaxID=1872138 RepID=UPI003D6B3C89
MGDRRSHGEPDIDLTQADTSEFDLSHVHSDDEYLDLLSGANLDDPGDVPGDQLSELLMSWRRDIETEPIEDLVDEKLAAVTVQAARLRRKRRPRLLVPVAAAAAVLAIAFAGVGLAARDAQPGDTLWALTKVLYSDHARSVEAAAEVKADLREAQAALSDGDLDEAKSKLEDAHAQLGTVSSEDGLKALEKQHAQLLAQLPGNPSGEAPQPPQPNPTTVPDPDPGSGSGTDTGTEVPTNPDTSESLPPDETTDPPEETTDPPPTSTEESRSEDPPPGGEPAAPGGGEPAGAQSVPGQTAGAEGEPVG